MPDPNPDPIAASIPRSTWDDARRIEAWAGEVRVNLIRIVGIALLYGRHTIEFVMAAPGSDIRGPYHLRVTAVAALWAVAAAMLHRRLRRRQLDEILPYAVTALDLFLLAILCMLGGGPRSPLLVLLFVIIAMAPLRLSLRMVYSATAGAMVTYLCLLAHYAWHVVGYQKYYATPELRIPRSHEAIMLLALLIAGLVAGQTVRQARRLAIGYPARVESPEDVR